MISTRRLVIASLRKPTPNTAPTAIWVELTGRPKVEAIITVIDADSATQKARTRFSFVIFSPTISIIFGPNNNRPIEIPMAPIARTQKGSVTLADFAFRYGGDNSGKWTNCVCDVVRTVRKRQQSSGAD